LTDSGGAIDHACCCRTLKSRQESRGSVERLHENLIDRHMRRLRQRPHDGGSNVARVQPRVPVLTALCKLSTRGFVGGAGGNVAVSVAGLHARDLHAAASALLAQGLAHTLDKELGARVPEKRDEGMALMQGGTLAHGKAGKRFPARVGSTA